MNSADCQMVEAFLEQMKLRNCSPRTVRLWRGLLVRFVTWLGENGVTDLKDVAESEVIEYQRALFHYRIERTGRHLRTETQILYLTPVRLWLKWLHRSGVLPVDPTTEFRPPKPAERLPTRVFTAKEMSRMLRLPDCSKPLGIRNRAILEVLYSTAIRCSELVGIQLRDFHFDRGVLHVRQGKNLKDRVVPLGNRAIEWARNWSENVRPKFQSDTSPESPFFTSRNGRPIGPNYLSRVVREFLVQLGYSGRGSCHLIRHTAATLMMENGADLRSLQELLGHARLNTTQLYTRVSITRLKEVHRLTHPSNWENED